MIEENEMSMVFRLGRRISMAKYFRKFFTLAVNDLANQYAIPAKSLTGYVLTKYCARRTDRLNKAVVDSLNIQKGNYISQVK
ncbi:hypothetical protein ANCDUO_20122 [Ancylostoma duodenale]|uniref:Uncharacterized protein n=1 Tax=Ancylostoma duodenale TaxID=51022 RepID=A0A0C2FSY9_9BILA|nr:hypothetical protein ANCDUO_20122 [Ancylostoma duodenale]